MSLRVIYIVGNSRSGTTMLSRMMNNHSRIYTLPELHFFERYDAEQSADFTSLRSAAIYLLRIIRNGFYDSSPDDVFMDEADKFIQHYKPSTYSDVYKFVLTDTAKKNNSEIICEQTPQNIFYKKQIEKCFDQVMFIHIVRNPLDILLSQKRKWRRASQGASFIPLKETIRAFYNYHPYTISKIWNAVVAMAIKHKLYTVRYEDIITEPVNALVSICKTCNIDYETGMELVPLTGSSSNKDSRYIGINSSRVDAWKQGGLNSAEIFICNRVNRKLAQHFKYDNQLKFPNPIQLVWYAFYWPVHILIAILLNLGRQRNIVSAIKRRLNV